jgi:teichuronic acid biosynthesis glycosyltransferase TuaH
MTAAAGQPGPWEDVIVLCATTRYDGMPMGDWHLAKALSRLAPVLFVDPPMSWLTPLKHPDARGALTRPRLTMVRPGTARLTPVVQPCPSRPGMAGLATLLTRRHLRRALARLGGRVAAVISGWPLYPVHGACGERVSVYWAKDDFVGGAALLGENSRLLAVRERRIACAADLVVAANPVVASTWRSRGLHPLLIPFGTDADAYLDVDNAPLPPDAGLPAPVMGFVGRINSRTDLSLLEGIASRGRSLLLVGPKDPGFEPERFAALASRPNVRWVGPKPFEVLPSYMRVIDVGLVPYRDSAFNRGSFPLKTLEYLAAARAVVGTDLPATRWLATDLVCIANGPVEFADQADRLAAARRTPEIAARRREFASRHSWAGRAQEVYAAINAHCPD